MRHLAYNAVFLEPQLGGVVTYAEHLIPEVAALVPDTRVTVFCNPDGHAHLRERGWDPRIELVDVGRLGAHGARAVTELTVLGLLADRRGADVVHSLAFTGPLRMRAAHVVSIHDVIWMHHADSALRFTARLWKAVVPRVVRRADRVFALTETAGAEVSRALSIPADRLDVVHPGIEVPGDAPATPERELRERLDLGDGPVVLCVAAIKEHKNLARLQEAMAGIPEATLVLAGAATPYSDVLRAAAPANVRLTGFVSDADLEGLYRLASAFVLPSLEEGFGLPVLDAMARGVPTACSDLPVLREVAGDAAVLFDPHSPAAIGAAIRSLLADPGERAARGPARAAQFTWRASAQAAVAGYRRALGLPSAAA